MRDVIQNARRMLLARAADADFEGHDPYDGLNSGLFRVLGLHRVPFFRLAWIQFFRRSLVDFRPLMAVPNRFNPKGGALFLMAALKVERAAPTGLVEKLLESAIRTPTGNYGWGYPFDWQAKAFYVARGTPNVVSTVYVANALLDYCDLHPNLTIDRYIQSARDFIVKEMLIWEKESTACFAYIPGKRTEVHNANLWAAAFLSRVEKRWPSKDADRLIQKAVRFSLSDIQPDGEWPYGTEPHHRWMDSFHTGFNMEALLMLRERTVDPAQDATLVQTAELYLREFFTDDGVPKYYRTALNPVDIHTIAESLIVLMRIFSDSTKIFSPETRNHAKKMLDKVLTYLFREFWNPNGYFYYQKSRWGMNRIDYMRWSQAWMAYALSFCIESADG